MSDLLLQGLQLTAAGLGLTFGALALLILAIVVLQRLFGTRPLLPSERRVTEKTAGSSLARDTEDEEIVAAIAVALAHFRSLDICRSGLGTALEKEPGAWWHAGRQQQHALGPLPPVRIPERLTGYKEDKKL